jgi:hypothetical protein
MRVGFLGNLLIAAVTYCRMVREYTKDLGPFYTGLGVTQCADGEAKYVTALARHQFAARVVAQVAGESRVKRALVYLVAWALGPPRLVRWTK